MSPNLTNSTHATAPSSQQVAAKVSSGNDHPPNQNVRVEEDSPLVVGVKVRFRIEVMFFIM